MNFPSADRLEDKVGNKYSLVIVAAKRARQLKEGAMPMADVTSENVLSQALAEVQQEKISAIAPPDVEEREALPLIDDASSAAVLLASLGGDDLDLDDEESDSLLEDEEEGEDELIIAPTGEEEEEEAEEPEGEESEEEGGEESEEEEEE